MNFRASAKACSFTFSTWKLSFNFSHLSFHLLERKMNGFSKSRFLGFTVFSTLGATDLTNTVGSSKLFTYVSTKVFAFDKPRGRNEIFLLFCFSIYSWMVHQTSIALWRALIDQLGDRDRRRAPSRRALWCCLRAKMCPQCLQHQGQLRKEKRELKPKETLVKRVFFLFWFVLKKLSGN